MLLFFSEKMKKREKIEKIERTLLAETTIMLLFFLF